MVKQLGFKIFMTLASLTLVGPAFATLKKDKEVGKAKLHVFPQANRTPFLKAISEAEKSLHLAVYKLSDPEIIKALEKAAKRNVQIKIIYEPNIYKHSAQSEQSSTGVESLKNLPTVSLHTHSKDYAQVHHKLIIIDEKKALISTINFDKESFDGIKDSSPPCRDFSLEIKSDDNPELLNELVIGFEADLKDQTFNGIHPALIWGPQGQREKIIKLIEAATESIDLYQQDIQDKKIVGSLISALDRGIKIRLIMMPFPFDSEKKKDNNIPNQNLLINNKAQVGLVDKHYIHAKAMLIDGSKANKKLYIGSTNFYAASLDKNRELGLVTTDRNAIENFSRVFSEDWDIASKNILR